MTKGESVLLGSVRIAQNGYHYVKTADGWKLKHHIIAEAQLGRPIKKTERVFFVDRDRTNFDPENIKVEEKKAVTKATTRARLEARRDEIEAQLRLLDEDDTSST